MSFTFYKIDFEDLVSYFKTIIYCISAASDSCEHYLSFSSQTIHIAIVCAGYNASRDVVTLVKSVLFHR